MIGGLLVDLLAVAAVAAFAWAGLQLGAVRSVGRAVASLVAVAAAVLARDRAAGMVQDLLGTSDDFSRLVGMLGVGIVSFGAGTRMFEWWRERRLAARAADEELRGIPDPLEADAVAIVAGGLLGMLWAAVFIAMLVLLPGRTFVSGAAASSFTGGALIAQEGALRWLAEGFPHYTQTLPKGRDGAVVGERGSIPMRGEVEPRAARGDADVLLRAINAVRRRGSVQVLTYNPDLAAVARRHALALAADRSLSYRSPAGSSLDGRARAALGESAGAFEEEIGIEVAWAHGPGNAAHALLEDERAGPLLRASRWSEIGIGVADAGWFNGGVYVLLLVAPFEEGSADARADDGDDGAAAAAGEAPPGGTSDPFTAPAECGPAIDIDGDGQPDEESLDPACLDDTSPATAP